MRSSLTFKVVFLFLFSIIQLTTAQNPHQIKHDSEKTKFKSSHKMGAGNPFDQGLEMLHHMMYEQAADLFNQALEVDSNNVKAHWGIAMTVLRPLHAPPNTKDFEKGFAAIEKAISSGNPTEKERENIQVLHNFYTTAKEKNYRQGLAVWKKGLNDLHEKYPNDIEIASFYGLSLVATAPLDDKTYTQQQEAGALLEKLHKIDPQHPGPFHYSIHAYDNPVLAEKGIIFANAYNKIAPDVPHALHMPSHIFVRLGKWDETISWNIRSAESALRQPEGNMTSFQHAHALDYLIYAYLQQGKDEKAKLILEELNSIDNYQPNFTAAYAIAAIHARYILERRKWKETGNPVSSTFKIFPWKNFPQCEAITWWTQGLGAAMNKDLMTAREAVDHLKILENQTREKDEEYWAFLVNTQRKTVEAWILYTEGNNEEALALMSEAADQEDSVEKHPITPGSVLPARELLGDMFQLNNKPIEAIAAYEAALEVSPNRFNSLYGAGKAAELAGKADLAKKYFQQLLKITVSEESKRSELDLAKAFLQKN